MDSPSYYGRRLNYDPVGMPVPTEPAAEIKPMSMPQRELEAKYKELQEKHEKLRLAYSELWAKAQAVAHELKSHFIGHKDPT